MTPRMHVAVVLGGNIQCNHCNRRYVGPNESRRGVVSQKLTPEQAVMKLKRPRAAIGFCISATRTINGFHFNLQTTRTHTPGPRPKV